MAKQKIKQRNNKDSFLQAGQLVPWAILTVLLLLYYLKVNINYGDDIEFLKALDNKTFWQWTAERYHTWSSRNLIEGVMLVFRIWAPDLWRVLNVAVYVVMGYLIFLLFTDGSENTAWVIAGGIMMLFGWDLHDAGYIASSLNYLWPGACALAALVPVKKVMEEKPIGSRDYLFLIPAIFAANEELTAVLIAGTGAVVIAFLIWKEKKVPGYVWAMWIAGAAGLLYIMTCPGNQVRTAQEIAKWYPQFEELTFLEKMENGFLSASYSLIRKGNYLYVFLAVIMAAAAVINSKGPGVLRTKVQNRLPGLILAVFITVFGCLRPLAARIFPGLSADDYVEQLFPGGNVTVETMLFAGMWVLIFIVLYQASGDRKRFFKAGYMMLFGLGSKTVMGFSPTVYASGNRTCFFLLMSTIIVTAVIVDQISEKLSAKAATYGSRLYGLAGIYVIGCQIMAVWRM